eukprot:820044-Amphidinium_carterae.2
MCDRCLYGALGALVSLLPPHMVFNGRFPDRTRNLHCEELHCMEYPWIDTSNPPDERSMQRSGIWLKAKRLEPKWLRVCNSFRLNCIDGTVVAEGTTDDLHLRASSFA